MSKQFIEEVRYPEVPDFDHIKYEPIENERTCVMSEFDKMVEFLDSTYTLKDQLVPCLVGPPGIGKTAAVNKHRENVHAKNLVVIIASQILPNEVSGITMPDTETKAMEIYDHFRLSTLEDGDILFFDELLEADQMVLSACLTLIESRMLMSGKKLPDIQIVAATNPTIQPTMLKENIRQRFLFRNFELDGKGTRQFILDDCGIDVNEVLGMLQETGKRYNILTPRSLTKMARWMASAETEDEALRISRQINAIWNNDLGTCLYNSAMNTDPNKEAREILRKAFIKNVDACDRMDLVIDWKNDSMTDLMSKLESLKEWDDILEDLKNTEMKTTKQDYDDINF